jgi:carbamoyltransferase
MRTEMDVLVLENCVLLKGEQTPLAGDSDWKKEFDLD